MEVLKLTDVAKPLHVLASDQWKTVYYDPNGDLYSKKIWVDPNGTIQDVGPYKGKPKGMEHKMYTWLLPVRWISKGKLRHTFEILEDGINAPFINGKRIVVFPNEIWGRYRPDLDVLDSIDWEDLDGDMLLLITPRTGVKQLGVSYEHGFRRPQ